MRTFRYSVEDNTTFKVLAEGYLDAIHPVDAHNRVATRYRLGFPDATGVAVLNLREILRPDADGFRQSQATPIQRRNLFKEPA